MEASKKRFHLKADSGVCNDAHITRLFFSALLSYIMQLAVNMEARWPTMGLLNPSAVSISTGVLRLRWPEAFLWTLFFVVNCHFIKIVGTVRSGKWKNLRQDHWSLEFLSRSRKYCKKNPYKLPAALWLKLIVNLVEDPTSNPCPYSDHHGLLQGKFLWFFLSLFWGTSPE